VGDEAFNHEGHEDIKNTKDLGVWFTIEIARADLAIPSNMPGL
jgi:hypothetical protein